MTKLYCPKCRVETNDCGYCEQCGATWDWTLINEFSDENREAIESQQEMFE